MRVLGKEEMEPTTNAQELSVAQKLFLFYVVCDESTSMTGEPVATLNRMLPQVHQDVRDNPAIDNVRFSLVAFADQPSTLVGLADLADINSMPGLTANGSTNYEGVFDHLRAVIERDVRLLRADNFRVARPCVFFLSDGAPNPGTDWMGALAKLTDPGFGPHPNIVAFGIGKADETVLRRVGTLATYMVVDETETARALSEWAVILQQSMVSAASTGTISVPANVPGFRTVAMDSVTA
jgi:uncharacterized protein YegL